MFENFLSIVNSHFHATPKNPDGSMLYSTTFYNIVVIQYNSEKELFIMKKAIAQIIEKLPCLKKHVQSNENLFMRQQALNELSNDVEKTFIQLVWFFEKPEQNQFELNLLYQHLNGKWLNFALETITLYFRQDTFLLPNPTDSVIISDDYLDQNGASRFLAKKGLSNFPQSKIATYIQRGTFPREDILIAGKKFWKIKTIEDYAADQLEKRNSYRTK